MQLASPSGFDCSGYIWYVFRQIGGEVPRVTFDQYAKLAVRQEPRPGDLVYFHTAGPGASHVGIYIGDGKFLHAPQTGYKIDYANLNDAYWRANFEGIRSAFVHPDDRDFDTRLISARTRVLGRFAFSDAGLFALLYDWARTGHGFPLIGNGKNRYQLLDVEDLCEAIWACMTLPDEQVDDVFNIGAEQFTTLREDWQAVLDVAGYGKKMRGFPAWPLVWGLRFLEVLHLSPLYKWVYETAGKDSFVSIDKAVARLGFAPKYSTSQALVRNYRWYLANLDKFEGASGVSHRVPWKQGLLRFFKMFF